MPRYPFRPFHIAWNVPPCGAGRSRYRVQPPASGSHANRLFDGSTVALPDFTPAPPPATPPKPGDFIHPPADPLGEINPRKQRDLTVAGIANGFWRVFTKGKDVPGNIEGWTATYAKLEPHIGPILDWLNGMWGDGFPPMPPAI